MTRKEVKIVQKVAQEIFIKCDQKYQYLQSRTYLSLEWYWLKEYRMKAADDSGFIYCTVFFFKSSLFQTPNWDLWQFFSHFAETPRLQPDMKIPLQIIGSTRNLPVSICSGKIVIWFFSSASHGFLESDYPVGECYRCWHLYYTRKPTLIACFTMVFPGSSK